MDIQNVILDQIPNYLFWKDSRSVYLGCNAYFANLANMGNSKDVIGKTDFDLPWTNIEAQLYRKEDSSVLQGKPKYNQIESLTKANGNMIYLVVNKKPLLDINQKICGVIGTASEIYPKNDTKPSQNHSPVYGKDELLAYLKSELSVLTYREIDNLSLWLLGYSLKDTANTFKVSIRTVEAHRGNIKLKMNSNTRRDIADYLHSRNLFNLLVFYARLL